MENQNDENEKPHEIITLVLTRTKFEVKKRKLIDKSRYFAALLSTSFAEYGRQEHVINYEIPMFSFEEFIYWLYNNKVPICEETDDRLDHLLILLEISVLFVVDDMIKDIIDILESDYLLPQYVIDIWLLAQELSINVLRDLSLAVCLDRFTELPINSICQLSKENFIKLVGNINVRTKESYLLDVAHKWMEYHKDTVQENLLKNKKPRILNSFTSYNNLDITKSTIYLHCWDGNNLFELTRFECPKDITNYSNNKKDILTGMQITGRGYDLYLCGGEFGIGSGKFNKKIWRYSLISKKWFFQTNLPTERRHMIATFICNKLFLIGGVGKYRVKLRSVDIYNIHTDIWTKGADTPTDFTDVPEYYSFCGKLFLHTHLSKACVYDSNGDYWFKIHDISSPPSRFVSSVPASVYKTAPCLIKFIQSDDMIMKCVMELRDMEQCKFCSDDPAMCGKFYHPCFYVREIPFEIRDFNKFHSLLFYHSPTRVFNIINPAYLHTQSAILSRTT